MDIYIKPAKKALLTGRDSVRIKDFAEVVAPSGMVEAIKKLRVVEINEYLKARHIKNGKAQILVSVTDVIRAIQNDFPEVTVSNVGEIDTVIDYKAQRSVDNKYWKYLKITFVSLILLAGSSTAIMSFHADAEIPKIFKNYYKIFYGEETETPYIIDIPYSIGLAVGIIVFFNHFGGKKITQDPTPIEVEMSQYDNDVTDTVIDTLDSQARGSKKQDGYDGNGNT